MKGLLLDKYTTDQVSDYMILFDMYKGFIDNVIQKWSYNDYYASML